MRLATALALLAGAAAAHDGPHDKIAAASAPFAPFPVSITAEFDLIDQTGARRGAKDFLGSPMLVFFGYSSCDAICDVALPRMAEALDLLGRDAAALTPVMITVDPANDTPERLAEVAADLHPRLVALTGDPERLAEARRVFGVDLEHVFDAPDGTPVFAHGSLIYLIGAHGELLTVLPPILGPDRIAEIVSGYL